jgi:hypothetical protein
VEGSDSREAPKDSSVRHSSRGSSG